MRFARRSFRETTPRTNRRSSPPYITLSYKRRSRENRTLFPNGSGECGVCSEAFKERDECAAMVNCRHIYHCRCIDTWLATADPGNHCAACNSGFYGGYVPPDPPPIPSHVQEFVECCSEPFEKQLTSSDVTSRMLHMPKSDVDTHVIPMLNAGERYYEVEEQGVEVTVYDVAGKEYRMVFKSRHAGGGRDGSDVIFGGRDRHCLSGEGWKVFREDHGLVANRDFVTFWVFRNDQTGRLCFVMSSRRLPLFRKLSRRKRGS